jgi:two-component system, LytTR family, sensor kinase
MKNAEDSHYSWLHYKITAKDWLMHLLVTPAIVVIANYWLLGPAYFSDSYAFISATLAASFIASVLSVTNMRSMFLMRRKYPGLQQTGKRLLSSIGLYALADIIGCTLILLWYDYLPSLAFTISIGSIIKVTVVLLISATMAGLGYEFFYSFGKWKESILENERLQKLQAQAELSVLKSQVNPHFLFNSLNSLSSLISDDSERAERYLNEMTKVYRYLIRNNEVELTSLNNELQFIHSYFHLLKTRYGQGIDMQITVFPEHEHYLLPPLTLQLLVENAVKHNTILKNQPLLLKLFSNHKNELVVTNNLQKKTLQVDSTKIGLSNISSKYKLLNKPGIQVHQTETAFTVILPLIPHEEVVLKEQATYFGQ